MQDILAIFGREASDDRGFTYMEEPTKLIMTESATEGSLPVAESM